MDINNSLMQNYSSTQRGEKRKNPGFENAREEQPNSKPPTPSNYGRVSEHLSEEFATTQQVQKLAFVELAEQVNKQVERGDWDKEIPDRLIQLYANCPNLVGSFVNRINNSVAWLLLGYIQRDIPLIQRYDPRIITALKLKVSNLAASEIAKFCLNNICNKTHYALLHQLYPLASLVKISNENSSHHVRYFSSPRFPSTALVHYPHYFGLLYGLPNNNILIQNFISILPNSIFKQIKSCHFQFQVNENMCLNWESLPVHILPYLFLKLDGSDDSKRFITDIVRLCHIHKYPPETYKHILKSMGGIHKKKLPILINAFKAHRENSIENFLFWLLNKKDLEQKYDVEKPQSANYEKYHPMVVYFHFLEAALTGTLEITHYVYHYILTSEEREVIRAHLDAFSPQHAQRLKDIDENFLNPHYLNGRISSLASICLDFLASQPHLYKVDFNQLCNRAKIARIACEKHVDPLSPFTVEEKWEHVLPLLHETPFQLNEGIISIYLSNGSLGLTSTPFELGSVMQGELDNYTTPLDFFKKLANNPPIVQALLDNNCLSAWCAWVLMGEIIDNSVFLL